MEMVHWLLRLMAPLMLIPTLVISTETLSSSLALTTHGESISSSMALMTQELYELAVLTWIVCRSKTVANRIQLHQHSNSET